MMRRLWYLALGALLAHLWYRLRGAAGAGARIVVDIPRAVLPGRIAGFAVHVMRADPDPDDGDGDPETGLPGLDPKIWGGTDD